MRKAEDKAQDDEALRIREKQEKARQQKYEVEKANAEAILHKKQVKLEEAEEDERRIAYNEAKAIEEFERQRQSKLIVDEKERELAKVFDAKERATNRQDEIDQLRAQRAYE